MDLLAQVTSSTDWPAVTGWGGFIALVLAWVARELFPFIRDRRKADIEQRYADEDRIVKPYLDQISSLRADVTKLDGLLAQTSARHGQELSSLRNEHLDCVKNHSALQATVILLQTEVNNLREWRHGIANQQQIAAMHNAAEGKQL